MQQYLENYADQFKLRSHFQLGVTIINIKRSEKTSKWIVTVKYQSHEVVEEEFEKVVVTTGTFHSAIMPQIPGYENFKGRLIHCQAFKKRVPKTLSVFHVAS